MRNGLYSKFGQGEDSVGEPNGFINQPFGYHPKLGGYPDLYNHLLGAMKIWSVTAAVLFLCAACCVAAESIPAAQVKWKEHFGESRIDTNTMFCLMAQGGFRAETTNVEKLVTTWLKAHPKAVVRTVLTHRPLITARPSSTFAYVWVVQGSDNLNVELVRQGCFAAGTQSPMEDDKIQVPAEDYQAFVAQIAEAAEEAKREKRGIGNTRPSEQFANQTIAPTGGSRFCRPVHEPLAAASRGSCSPLCVVNRPS